MSFDNGATLSMAYNALGERVRDIQPEGSRVAQPGDWQWSSWRLYFLNDASLLPMDRIL